MRKKVEPLFCTGALPLLSNAITAVNDLDGIGKFGGDELESGFEHRSSVGTAFCDPLHLLVSRRLNYIPHPKDCDSLIL